MSKLASLYIAGTLREKKSIRRRFELVAACAAFLSCGDPELPLPTQRAPAPRPRTNTSLVVKVTDAASGQALPAKLLLYPQGKDEKLIRFGGLDFNNGGAQDAAFCTLQEGVLGTWEGIALAYGSTELPVGKTLCGSSQSLPFGKYRLVVMRGTEYEPFETLIELRELEGPYRVEAPLHRAFDIEDTVSADMHVHAFGSGDSLVPRSARVITESSAGIQVIGSSDHNFNGDYQDEIEALNMQPFIAAIPGNEASVNFGHFNLFPVIVEPEKPHGGSQVADWIEKGLSARQFFDAAHALPGQPIIQVNHARLGYAAYFDMVRWDGTSWPPPMPVNFDALEVLSGFLAYNEPGDPRLEQSITDLYTLTQHGVLVSALGNSDTHHLNGILAGFPRTYVRMPGAGPAPSPRGFNALDFMDALRQRHTVASTGPWLDVTAGTARPGDTATASGGSIHIQIRIRQVSFVHANRVRIFVDGKLRRTLAIPPAARSFDWSGDEIVGPNDTWLGVDTMGDDRLPEELTGNYLSQFHGMRPAAVISPILIDVNGDGKVELPLARLPGPPVDFVAPPRAHLPADQCECGAP